MRHFFLAFAVLGLSFVYMTSTAFGADEEVLDLGNRIPPGGGGVMDMGAGHSSLPGQEKGPSIETPGDELVGASGDAVGNKLGCQECQSDTEFFSGKVAVISPFTETSDKNLSKLKALNCCADKEGRVLSTKLGGC